MSILSKHIQTLKKILIFYPGSYLKLKFITEAEEKSFKYERNASGIPSNNVCVLEWET